jgi:dCMP deaminase
VKDKRILTTGYVGSPMGAKHCDEVGHEMHKVTHDDGTETMHCIRTIHAEQNALIQASRVGVSLQGATLYCTMTPCYTCAKLIINAGIIRVVAKQDYQSAIQTKRIFKETKVKLEILDKKITKY